MAEVGAGELQTLISTLQNGNVQLGHLIRATAGISPALTDVMTQLAAVTAAALTAQMGAVATHVGANGGAAALPQNPDGYVTVNIPGVGPRLIPYYPV